jgi:hypothetical protein
MWLGKSRGREYASVAQLVEQLICNQRVGGSNPLAGFTERIRLSLESNMSTMRGSSDVFFAWYGQVPKRPNGAGCKPAGAILRRFESFPAHINKMICGNSSVGRATAFQAVCRGFESRFPLLLLVPIAHVAQLVEHVLGKDGVTSSSLVVGFS